MEGWTRTTDGKRWSHGWLLLCFSDGDVLDDESESRCRHRDVRSVMASSSGEKGGYKGTRALALRVRI
jgi:hypothetical protein